MPGAAVLFVGELTFKWWDTGLGSVVAQNSRQNRYARCSVTIYGGGSGKSKTCRATWPVGSAAVNAAPHAVQVCA